MLRHRRTLALAVALVVVAFCTGPAHAGSVDRWPAPRATGPATGLMAAWTWPVDGPRSVVRPFEAPAHDYAAGHRGIDIAAPANSTVRAPSDGVIAFAGTVVDRPLVTIDHGDGIVSTLEPVAAALPAGSPVRRADAVGSLAVGGHARAGELHLGVRRDGEYVNPLLLLDDVPRAVLLPCCDRLTRAGARGGTPP